MQAEKPLRTPPETSLSELARRAERDPRRVHVEDVDGRSLSYAETATEARRWAAVYRSIGVEPGEIVVTMQNNTIDSLLGWYGLSWLGATEAPVNVDYRADLLVHALNLTRARTMACLGQFVPRLLQVADRLEHLRQVVVLDDEEVPELPWRFWVASELLAGAEPADDLELPAPWQIGAILFTSGTTGPSKAVRLPWAQIVAMAQGAFLIEDLNADEVIYNPGPTYHVGSKCFPTLASLLGARHVMRPWISESRIAEDYLRHGVTTGTAPREWVLEPDAPEAVASALRNVLVPTMHPTFIPPRERRGWRTYSTFNMTELSCPVGYPTWSADRFDDRGRASQGTVRPGYEVRIVDEHDQPLPPGEVGEIVFRSDIPWVLNAGYLNMPEPTAAAWQGGWFHTGDAGYLDGEGWFYFIDRLKDCIRRRGENISSFDVEMSVMAHPEVALAAAIAVKENDRPGANEEVKVCCVRTEDSSLDGEGLVRWLIGKMPRFMVPRYVEFFDELPLTPTQKVRKVELRKVPLTERTFDRDAAGIEIPRDG
ncbi:MAG: AMP-binding protein [Gammaproteobacteria bacterium]|nr:AMP-binding protein [Gammaproteobacteria bacterium]